MPPPLPPPHLLAASTKSSTQKEIKLAERCSFLKDECCSPAMNLKINFNHTTCLLPRPLSSSVSCHGMHRRIVEYALAQHQEARVKTGNGESEATAC